MTSQQLALFLAAAEHRSFSGAARALELAQPSVSEAVRRLEEDLGVPLFARSRRGLELTEAGQALRPYAERVVADLEAARDSVSEVRELRGGIASFGTFGTAGHYLVTDLVAGFRRRYPAVRVRVVGKNSSEVADLVRDGTLEAGLIVLPIDDAGLDVRPAVRDEILYVSRDPRHVNRRVGIERLASVPLILYDASFRWDDPTRRQLRERAQAAGIALEPAIEVEELEAALDLARLGFGDTIVGRGQTIRRPLPRGLGTARFADPIWETAAFVTRRGAELSPATRAFVTLAEDRMSELRGLLGKDALV
jgi:DNA-binding transcriptional LysR family regulator